MHAQGVQLHQLTGVVFVQASGSALRAGAACGHALGLIQVQQHGRMPGTGQQQVFKLAHGVGPNGVDQVMPDKRTHRALANEHVEVVKPELGHARQQRGLELGLAATGEPPGGGLQRQAAGIKLRGQRFRKVHAPLGHGIRVGAASRAPGSLRGIGLDLLAQFAFTLVGGKNVWQGGIEIGQVGCDQRRFLARAVGQLNLLQRPGTRAAGLLHLSQQVWGGAIAHARHHAPGAKLRRCGLRRLTLCPARATQRQCMNPAHQGQTGGRPQPVAA